MMGNIAITGGTIFSPVFSFTKSRDVGKATRLNIVLLLRSLFCCCEILKYLCINLRRKIKQLT